MYLTLVRCVCIVIYFIGARSQRAWGPNGFNSGFSSSWTPNGFSNQNVGSWGLNRPNQPVFGGNQFNTPFGVNRRPIEQQAFGNSNDQTGWNSGISGSGISGTGFNTKPDEKKASIINVANTNTNSFSQSGNENSWGQASVSSNQNSKTNEWNSNNANIDKPQSNSFSTAQNENSFSSLGSGRPSGTNQNSKLNNNNKNNKNNNNNNNSNRPNSNSGSNFSTWGSNRPTGTNAQNSNSFNNNKPIGNDIPTDSDYEDNSVYSWNPNNKEKNKPNKNKWETTTSKTTKSTTKPSNSNWNQNGDRKTQEESNTQNEKKTVDTSILDELDKNDWYFGKESNYPKPPFKSVLNIDVSELWNFDRNRNSNQNSKNNKSRGSNNNSRRNRQTGEGEVECECVNVSLCDEEDMIVAQEDIKGDWRPLQAFRCDRLTEVCCTNPKLRFSSRSNVQEESAGHLYCGQSRFKKGSFGALRGNVAEPGQFPWNLQLQNSEMNCSASLIHPQLALTAAHCVSDMEPAELNLKAGIWSSNNEQPQTREVSRIILHPSYSSQNPRNDIALLVMENGFELNDNVNTICLPVTNDKWDSDQCLVAGWGVQEINGEVVEVLEKGAVDFMPQPECQNIMLVTDLWRNYILHDSFVCAREKTGSNACLGSEGAPVICPSQKQPGTYLQIGLVSKGMNCDNFGRPGIFTNVLKFLDWINKNHFDLGLNFDLDIRNL